MIYLRDFIEILEAVHSQATEQAAGRKSFPELLDRLITVKLIVQEARNI